MPNFLETFRSSYKSYLNKNLLIAPIELLLIIIVTSLFITVFITMSKFTRAPISINGLKTYLDNLHTALISNKSLNADTERSTLEKHMNFVKVHCTEKAIALNTGLEESLQTTCNDIQIILESKEVGKRSTWQQLRDTAFGFKDLYYQK